MPRRKNLQHFGLSADVALGDARQIDGQYDAIATDLPYGINLVRDSSQEIEILSNLRTCAPKAAFIDLRDLSKTLTDLGYQIEAILPVPKLSIVRRIFYYLCSGIIVFPWQMRRIWTQ